MAAVVLTGTERTNARMGQALQDVGFEVLEWSSIELVPVDISQACIETILSTDGPLIFVSPGVVDVLERRWPNWMQSLGDRPVLSMGPGTTLALSTLGIRVEREANPPRVEGMLDVINAHFTSESEITILCGDRTRPELCTQLISMGFDVDEQQIYRNQAPSSLVREPCSLLAVVYTSPSGAQRILSSNPWLFSVPAVAIGPTTARWLIDQEDHHRVHQCASPTSQDLAEVLASLQ